MRIHAYIFLAAAAFGVAQDAAAPAPPPEVDQALRAQISLFAKHQSEGNFRKAYELVSEESKDYYLGMTKQKSAAGDIQKIEYFDNFTKAEVTSVSKQILSMLGRPVEIPSATIDRWKIDGGQWKWYHEPSQDVVMTILGPMASAPGGPSAAPPPATLPKDFSPNAVAEAASKLLPPKATINRRSVPFVVGREATEEVVFHNNSIGPVRVEADIIREFPGFEVEPKSSMVNPQAEATFTITYHPAGEGVFNAALRLTIQPFEKEIRIPLKFTQEAAAPKP